MSLYLLLLNLKRNINIHKKPSTDEVRKLRTVELVNVDRAGIRYFVYIYYWK